jgi:tetratricopeptide (TPR) repeat protein
MNENKVTLRQALYETRNGDPKRALEMWREIIDRDEHLGPAHHVCGLLSMKLEAFADAEFHFRKAVSAHPDNWDYHKDLGMAVEARKGLQASIDHFRRVIMDCRSNPEMYVILANQLIGKGSYLAALDAADAALRMDHTSVTAWLERSRALVHLNYMGSAGASLAMARHLDPVYSPGATPDWARAYSFMWSAPNRAPKLGAESVAICLTGSCEMLKYTTFNLRGNLLDRLPGADLFVVTPDDGAAHFAERLNPVGLNVRVHRPIPEDRFVAAHRRSGTQRPLQAWLQQLGDMKAVSDLMDTVEEAYDAVVYVQSNVWLQHAFPDISRLDLSVVHTPHQDLRGGLNTGFAVGSYGDMDVYLTQLDVIAQSPERLALGPEGALMRHLIQSGVIPVLDPRLEMRLSQFQSGRMVLQPPDWVQERSTEPVLA